MKSTLVGIFLIFVLHATGLCENSTLVVYKSENLKIERVTANTYLHVSYLEIPNYGTFPCNGLVYINNQEAIIFDTPAVDIAAVELIQWIEKEMKSKIMGVVINHFHDDCLGSLKEFHKRNITSYANQLTIELAVNENMESPKVGFDTSLKLTLGNKTIVNQYFGEGHTRDNIISYLPDERMVFGGCLIKETGASKGNLADANVTEWSATVENIKQAYPNIKFVIPGHGKHGDQALLDYTIKLFEKN